MRMLVRQNKYFSNLYPQTLKMGHSCGASIEVVNSNLVKETKGVKHIDYNDNINNVDDDYGYFYDLDVNDNKIIIIENIPLNNNYSINNILHLYTFNPPRSEEKLSIKDDTHSTFEICNVLNNYFNKCYPDNYVYQKKDDDIEENKKNENNELIEKYNELYIIFNIILITSTSIVILYFIFTM